ncbi:kinase galactokinase/mevalonate kinase [Gloeocapsa sp. PCC 73106]|uniref:GHMP family kinase ATP-binding protein n=1 Tax=Gloeocapsa sp. PCC 73106 TaxID=102232 RepID=UPI0002ABB9A4|nr:kinase galactokinase/mevalonate kinase [Gloeocapsa sp. PCC 73106]ELR96426.1 putative kinase, galactokinase/mevalonate kinase [Gloeocapsa sp. PCC 73106]
MYFRAKAPLRLGLAGGGTDVSPYSDEFGGAILNATISLYAYASIRPRDDDRIVFESLDRGERDEVLATEVLATDGCLSLLKGVYNRVIQDYVHKPLAFDLTTYVDAPSGSGLGSSSTLIVAVLGAFSEWLKLPLGEYDMAHLAYEIERVDLQMAGGKQDQYAATFGGFNFIEFFKEDRVIVNPLRIKKSIVNELELSLVLFFSGISRYSSEIIDAQSSAIKLKNQHSLEAMHLLKEQAFIMKEALLKGDLASIGKILDIGWNYKKQTSSKVSNSAIDEIYQAALDAGSTGGKISGAGGGGFMMFFCPGNNRYPVIEVLKRFGGEFRRFQFVEDGVLTWSSKL